MAINLNKVVYPTDFSEFSRYALRYAREFATAFRAELHCIHVVEGIYTYEAGIPAEDGGILPVGGDMLELATQRMKQFAEVYLADLEVPPVTEVLEGKPFLGIIDYARKTKADLIVLGTHGRSGLSHALLGSTTEKIVRKAPCPVLSIRHPEHEFTMP
jgi:nucleotide-binding universal stress UspA family protein